MSDNKRRRNRIGFNDRILCYKHIITTCNVKPDPAPIRIEIKDISYSGIGMVCNRDLGTGDFLIFNLETNGMTKEFMMEVRWCKYADGKYEAGLQSTSLTKEMLLFLDSVIKNHIKKQTRLGRSV